MIFVFIGFPLSIVLFVIGVILGLLRKGWRLAGISFAIFIIVVVVYSTAQSFYIQKVHPSAIENLQPNLLNE